MPGERGLYRRWIVANGWAEAAGLGTTFALGRLVAPLLDQGHRAVVVLAGAAAAVLLGVLLEGVLVGAAQESVLRQRLRRLRPWAWTLATAAGAGLAWFLGMVPSTMMALSALEPAGSAPAEPSAALQYALASGLGLVLGPVLGLAQWIVLRRLVRSAASWLWANALAWGVGMPLIFVGMDQVPWGGHPAVALGAIYAVCGAAGLVVGAVHGRVLLHLLRFPAGPCGRRPGSD